MKTSSSDQLPVFANQYTSDRDKSDHFCHINKSIQLPVKESENPFPERTSEISSKLHETVFNLPSSTMIIKNDNSESPTIANNDRSQTMSVYTERFPSDHNKNDQSTSLIKNYDLVSKKKLYSRNDVQPRLPMSKLYQQLNSLSPSTLMHHFSSQDDRCKINKNFNLHGIGQTFTQVNSGRKEKFSVKYKPCKRSSTQKKNNSKFQKSK